MVLWIDWWSSWEARVFIVPDRNAETLRDIITENCARRSTIHTDGFRSYNGLDSIRGYPLNHKKFVHAAGNNVRRALRG